MWYVVGWYLFFGLLVAAFAVGAEKNRPAKKGGAAWYILGAVVTVLLWPFLIAYGIGLAVKDSE